MNSNSFSSSYYLLIVLDLCMGVENFLFHYSQNLLEVKETAFSLLTLEGDKLAEKSALQDKLTLSESQIHELQVDTHIYTIMVKGVVTWELLLWELLLVFLIPLRLSCRCSL